MNKLQQLAARVFRIKALTARPRDMNLSESAWWLEARGFRTPSTGEVVSYNSMLGLPAFYCGTRMISETVGSLPLNVYKRRPVRGQDVWRSHPVHFLLHNEPNPEMTAMSFRQTLCSHAIGYGNAYAEIVRRGDGMPAQLWPLGPDRVRALRADDGVLWYEVRKLDGGVAYIPYYDMLHIPGLGFDGIQGYSLMHVALESIGINLAQQKYEGKFFSNGGHISLAAETDNVLKEDTFNRLKGELNAKLMGLDNAHRIALLEAGIKLKPLNINNVDAQLLEGKRFSVEDWARWLNMPPHKLKEMTHATFSNIEHQNIEWVVDTIRPWLIRFEQEYDRKLFRQKNIFYSKHVVEGLLRGDQKSRYEAYAIARNWGWMSPNDVLELEDRNPLEGDIGDIYLVPGNMSRAEDAGEMMDPKESTSEDNGEDNSREMKLTRAAASRLVGYECRQQHKVDKVFNHEEFSLMIMDWMATSQEVANKYIAMTRPLTLLGDDGIPSEEAVAMRIDLLTRLVTEGSYEAN